MHPWASALVFALTGLVFIAIGLLLAHRRREAVL
jgi:LPXTG-motif cell wall-anchored protein